MRALQYGAGVVLLALLALIAYDLHRVADALQPSPTIAGRLETHAERDARLKRQADAFAHDVAAGLGVGDLDKPAKQPARPAPSR